MSLIRAKTQAAVAGAPAANDPARHASLRRIANQLFLRADAVGIAGSDSMIPLWRWMADRRTLRVLGQNCR